MKKVLLSLSLLTFLGTTTLFTSCDAIKDKVKEEANIDIDFDFDGAEATIEIPVITTLDQTTYPDTASIPLNLNDQIAAANAVLTMKNISKVSITSAKLVFQNCDAQNNVSNFKSAVVLFYTNTNAETRWIATNDEIPDVQGEEITLVPDPNINLVEYLKTGTTVYYVTGVKMRRPTTHPLTAKLIIKYNMEGNTGYGE
jgi:hypothetical protein